jgi:hypothetical protein
MNRTSHSEPATLLNPMRLRAHARPRVWAWLPAEASALRTRDTLTPKKAANCPTQPNT